MGSVMLLYTIFPSFLTAVEQEVSYGIFNLKQNPNFTCFWIKRTFTDLLEQNPLNDTALVTYTDLTSGKRGLEFDSETMKALNHLKEARLPAKYIGYVLYFSFVFTLGAW